MVKPQGETLLRITSLKFPRKLKASLFELPPGTAVKVPRDLRVRLPKNELPPTNPRQGRRLRLGNSSHLIPFNRSSKTQLFYEIVRAATQDGKNYLPVTR